MSGVFEKTVPGDSASTATRQFLIRCLRSFLAVEGETPFEGVIEEEDVDWNFLLQLAAWHRVTPLLYRSLHNAGLRAAPVPVLSQIEVYVRSAAGHSLFLTGELLRLLKRLEAQGIPAIPFKGPALASLLYGDPALRHFDDIDILVRQEGYPSAKRLLLSLGYQPKYQLTKRQEKAYLQSHHHKHFTLTRGDMRVDVELHWSIVPEDFPFHQDWEGVWERCERISFAGMTVDSLAPEDLLLFLCVHGSRHLWSRLQWICDVAQLVKCRETMDWGRVVKQANTSGGWRMFLLGIFLANDVLGMPLPHELGQEIRHDSQVAKLANRVRWQLFEGPLVIVKPWKETFFRLQLIDRARNRIAYLPRYWFQKLTAGHYRHTGT